MADKCQEDKYQEDKCQSFFDAAEKLGELVLLALVWPGTCPPGTCLAWQLSCWHLSGLVVVWSGSCLVWHSSVWLLSALALVFLALVRSPKQVVM